MGAAIRHVSHQLDKQGARNRLLMILTDGKPNDVDHYEGRLALKDCKRAVIEARGRGQAVFAVTVDRNAQDYLPAIFGDVRATRSSRTSQGSRARYLRSIGI
ncbi:VWA domain-containing protein [Rhizobium laguerreae]|uniref:VWA domain-containing protein n=1 Tax=Rhizobium laguerreae TaxID=1076926 RepID=UPI001C9277F0|nr:VWA domain-containing protein [Rhizobium laguerreae]MBY3225400.1 VWA domain-containing protein [Rhizobium laguerreae]MBY3237795.1 VWA domain-containing protein [Rhizobium laguerreae]